MVEILENTEALMAEHHPTMIIVVYEGWNGTYIETHELIPEGLGGYVLGPAISLDNEQRKRFAAMVTKDPEAIVNDNRILPDHVLYYSNNPLSHKVIWFAKPGKYTLYFGGQNINKCEVEISLPQLIFMYEDKKLHVFATKEKIRPSENTKLFTLPFLNMYKDNSICLGNTLKQGLSLLESIICLEEIFYKARFCEDHLSSDTNKRGLIPFWKTIIKSKVFPMDRLIPKKETLKELLKER
jgi:PRTRC genetic system protein B